MKSRLKPSSPATGAFGKSGGLFRLFREKRGKTLSYVHVGDHPESDIRAAKQAGFAAVYRPAAVRESLKWRTEDLSFLTGSVYCGLTGGKLHCGERLFSRDYEYGYLYGGLYAVGFCRFIHTCRLKFGFDKLLFLSRDGSTLLEVYRLLYPEEIPDAVYAPWSRLAALKICFGSYKAEYLRRFLADKAGQGFSLEAVVRSMEVPEWIEPLCRETGFSPETHLTYKNLKKIENYFSENEAQLLEVYETQRRAGGEFYRALLKDCHRAAAVDIGWAGSGPLLLDYAVNEIWNLDCPITGILAGTETAHSAQPDAYAPFLTSGKLLAYLFSPFHNRDLWSFHDPAQGHNLYWELFSGTAEGGLLGFYPDENGKPVCRLRENHADSTRMGEIRRGMLDFARDFLETERRLGIQLPISGRTLMRRCFWPNGRQTAVFGRNGRDFSTMYTSDNGPVLYHAVSSYQLLEVILHRRLVHPAQKAVLLLPDFITEKYPQVDRLVSDGWFDDVRLFPYTQIPHREEKAVIQDVTRFARLCLPLPHRRIFRHLCGRARISIFRCI